MRKLYPLPGGIHPPQNKQQSKTRPLSVMPLVAQYVLPLAQHIGQPAKAMVEVGSHVLKGQQIAQAQGVVSASVHAPTSGTITAIEMRDIAHASGMQGLCIVLDADGKDDAITATPALNWQHMDNKELLDHLRQAGIIGMGGAGFPSAVKLNPPPTIAVQTLIINAVECEPYITADDLLMQENAANIMGGIEVVAKLVQPQEIVIALEDNKPEALGRLHEALANHQSLSDKVQISVIPTKYPSGGEKQVIYIITGKEVPSGGLPGDTGVVCQNIGTVNAIADAVFKGEALTQRVVTVTGAAIQQPQNLWVRIGTPVQALLDHCGSDTHIQRLIAGGPMMGFSLDSNQAPIVKTSNCILASATNELGQQAAEQACIRCGLCAEACPASLLPQQLYWQAKALDWDKAKRYNLNDCIECGACSYVCPSAIPLVQYFRFAKGGIKKQQVEEAKSDHARLRFEARSQRLEQEAAEKEAKRKARADAAKKKAAAKKAASSEPGTPTATSDADAKATVIAAALERTQAKKNNQASKNEDTP